MRSPLAPGFKVGMAIIAVAAAACTSSPAPGTSASKSSRPVPSPTTTIVPSGAAVAYQPRIDPAQFVSVVDNPYFPLTPGTTYVYTGVKDGQSQRDEVIVTRKKKVILGINCLVVKDTSTHDGTLLEQTEDWYTQDKDGNVWYFGEDTREFENGKVVSTEGSWQAGVDGAEPGIFMPAHPKVTDSFRQEYYPGHAEDTFWVVSLAQPIKVPYGHFTNTMLTLEFTRLEPRVIDRKYYVAGIGVVLEVSAAGPKERAELVSVSKP